MMNINVQLTFSTGDVRRIFENSGISVEDDTLLKESAHGRKWEDKQTVVVVPDANGTRLTISEAFSKLLKNHLKGELSRMSKQEVIMSLMSKAD